MTADLVELSDWQLESEATHVRMKSMEVFCDPVCNLLEGHFVVLLVSVPHIKVVHDRKMDIEDCEWIADVLPHRLLEGSYVSDRSRQELREIPRLGNL